VIESLKALPAVVPEIGSKHIAVVIPAYKVARHVRSVITGIPAFVTSIVVVDDASPDDSADVARSTGDRRVHVVSREVNGGVGAAVKTGYEVALQLGADIIVKMDGDDQMDPSFLSELVAPLIDETADYTKGNRFMHSRQLARMPARRRIGNMGLSFLTKAYSGYWEVFDPTNGYTAINAATLDALDWEGVENRYFFETSMLFELGLARAVVRDVSIPARYGDEQSSLSERRALFEFPVRLLRGMFRRIWMQYFVREFSPVALFAIFGLLMVVFGLGWGISHWLQSAATHQEASTGTVMIAVLPLILGVQLLLQALVLDIQGAPKLPLGRGRQYGRARGRRRRTGTDA
jgi:glycosyltransferase involved in cell wall biosynthesis